MRIRALPQGRANAFPTALSSHTGTLSLPCMPNTLLGLGAHPVLGLKELVNALEAGALSTKSLWHQFWLGT